MFSVIESDERDAADAAAAAQRSLATFPDISAESSMEFRGTASRSSALATSMNGSRVGNRSVHFDDAALAQSTEAGGGRRGCASVPRSPHATSVSAKSSMCITASDLQSYASSSSRSAHGFVGTPLRGAQGGSTTWFVPATPPSPSFSQRAALDNNVAPVEDPDATPFRRYARGRSLGGNPLMSPALTQRSLPTTPKRFSSRRVTHIDEPLGAAVGAVKDSTKSQ
jgi:hypothetical protein